jgi:cyclophilin family peptidyl-prolyl cis-trans isomerase
VTNQNAIERADVNATDKPVATHLLSVTPATSQAPVNQEVVFHTNLGDIVIELFADMPITTANFLNYVVNDRYDGTFFHRSVPNFVIQGGGYSFDGTNTNTVAAFAPITNEYSAAHPNALGTISMARTSDLNSATSQFFFNTVDNSSSLVNYAVFGQVLQGLTTGGNTTGTINQIAGLPIYNAGSPFDQLPLRNYSGSGGITTANLVTLISADVLAIANADLLSLAKSGTVSGSLTANDQDLDTPTFTIARVNGDTAGIGQLITLPSGAHVTVNANGIFSYDPNHSFDSLATGQSAVDSFTYTLANGSLVYGTATASFTVSGSGGGGPTILGTPNDDTLTGTAGNDVIDGLAGSDSMRGLAGDDTYYVDRQGDLVYELPSQGIDTVIASSGYYLYPYIENLTLASYAGNAFGVGNDLDNIITGNAANNSLLGGSGNDTIHGGGGIDIIYGESGADLLYGDAGNDFLAGGTGDDTIDGGAGGDSVYGEDGNDTLTGGATFEFDILSGGNGNDVLHGDSGQGDYDYLYGNAGDDSFYVDTGNDLTFEQAGEGTDTVYANVAGTTNGVYLYANIENLVLIGTTAFGVGNELANTMTGNASGNFLLGGAGNDILNGKGGNDVLFGEAGADIFVFEHGTGGDVIGDFVPGTDRIDLTAIGYTWQQLQSSFHENAGTTAIDLGNGDLVVLNGVTSAQLHQSDFILAGGSSGTAPVDAISGAAEISGALGDWHDDVALHDLLIPHYWGAGPATDAML